MLPRFLHMLVLWLAALGALNWGLNELEFNLLTYASGFATLVLWLIAASGGYLVYLLIKKKV